MQNRLIGLAAALAAATVTADAVWWERRRANRPRTPEKSPSPTGRKTRSPSSPPGGLVPGDRGER